MARAEWRHRIEFVKQMYGRPLLRLALLMYGVFAFVQWAVGEFGSSWLISRVRLGNNIPALTGWQWAVIGLLFLLVVGTEGAFRATRRSNGSQPPSPGNSDTPPSQSKQSHDMKKFDELRETTKPAPLPRGRTSPVSSTQSRQAFGMLLHQLLVKGEMLKISLEYANPLEAISAGMRVPADEKEIDAWKAEVVRTLPDARLEARFLQQPPAPTTTAQAVGSPLYRRLDALLRNLEGIIEEL